MSLIVFLTLGLTGCLLNPDSKPQDSLLKKAVKGTSVELNVKCDYKLGDGGTSDQPCDVDLNHQVLKYPNFSLSLDTSGHPLILNNGQYMACTSGNPQVAPTLSTEFKKVNIDVSADTLCKFNRCFAVKTRKALHAFLQPHHLISVQILGTY
jgi:hypothetical protein